jgi:superfamily II DNA or RNA helicase
MEKVCKWVMIKIEKINNVYIRVYSDDDIAQELSDFFTFEYPGARFTPKFKAKMWDGKVRLFDLQRKTLYVGLLKYLVKFAETHQYDVEFVNDVEERTDITLDTVNDFAKWLNPHARGVPIQIRDYQTIAVHKAIQDQRTLLVSPTASGKSFIIYTIMRYHLEHKRKCIVIVPTTSLVEQMHSDFAEYSSANGFNVDKHIQKLYSGFTKEFTSKVLITTWQSIYKQPESWFNQFDVIFGDEAHQFKATSLTSVMNKMTQVKYRIGTTGTLDNKKVHQLVLEGIFGPVYKVTTTADLMATNQVATLKIKCLMLKYPSEVRQHITNKMDYKKEIDFLISHDRRNKFIRNLALSCDGNTLVLFQMVEKHGKILYDLIKEKAEEGRKVFFIYGGTDVEAREEARKLTDKEDNAIIIASFGVFSTGVNIPSIENVIFASPSKSKIRNLQSIGRGLRLKNGKTHCKLFDISDDLHWKSWKNHTLNHFAERLKVYTEERFQYKIVEVEL